MGGVLYSADIISAVPDILRCGLYFCRNQNHLTDQNPIDLSMLTIRPELYKTLTSGELIND